MLPRVRLLSLLSELSRIETEDQIKAIWPSFGLGRDFRAVALSPESLSKARFQGKSVGRVFARMCMEVCAANRQWSLPEVPCY